MKINYIITSATPKLEHTDAAHNEMEYLHQNIDSWTVNVYPFSKPLNWFPTFVLGITKLFTLFSLDKKVDIHHIYVPSLIWFPVLDLLQKPIVYTVGAGISGYNTTVIKKIAKKVHTIIVASYVDLDILKRLDITNAVCINNAIYKKIDQQLNSKSKNRLRLLMASAPWTIQQFETKGIMLLLQLLRRMPNVSLTLIWRGLFRNKMEELIRHYQLESQVTLVDKYVDINEYFANTDVTVLLSSDTQNIKSFPHSLIESLFSGKPVILSKEIPMSQSIRQYQTGVVLEEFSLEALCDVINICEKDYDKIVNNVNQIDITEFSPTVLQSKVLSIYQNVIIRKADPCC